MPKVPSLFEVFQVQQDETKKKKKHRPHGYFVRAGHQVTVPAPSAPPESDSGDTGGGDVGEGVDEEDQVDVKAKNVHIDLSPHEHDDVYEGVANHDVIPSLTEVFHRVGARLSEALPSKDDYMTGKAGNKPLKGSDKRQADRMKRIQKKNPPGKRPTQMQLPGVPNTYNAKPPPKPGQFPEVQDDRMPLDQAKGKYLHISQSSPVTPYWLQQTGHIYTTIPSDMMKGLSVDSNPGSAWGSGTYKISDNGELKMSSSDFDSSG